MSKKKRRIGNQGTVMKWTVNTSTVQANNNAALDNLDRLWKLTEEVSKVPLSPQEADVVQKVRFMLMTLLKDIAGQQIPPLTTQDTLLFRQEIESFLQQPPFVNAG